MVLAATASNAIRVGAVAYRDPVLARSSLEAAAILREAVKRPKAARDFYVREQLQHYGGLEATRKYLANLKRLGVKGWGRNQAIFDSIRLVIADYYAQLGVDAIRAAIAQQDMPHGLGEDVGREVGCAITGGVTAIAGGIIGAFTGGAGAAVFSTGGTLVGQALDCGADARNAAQHLAQTQAQQAQAIVEQTRIQAQSQLEQAQVGAAARTKQITTVAIIGGAALLVVAAGYAVVKL